MMFNRKITKTLNSSLLPLGRRWHGVPDEGSKRDFEVSQITPHQVWTKLAKRSLSPTILSPKGEGYDETRHKATGTNSCNHLITQSPVLDLLHAHGDSPKERCSSRLVVGSFRSLSGLATLRPSANPLVT